jgi:cell cycle protein kinase DBF2
MAIVSEDCHGLRLPNPPPLLHTRGQFDRPGTPDAFTSPPQTPQGSPSKSRLPPGALDLPNVFDKAMKLTPTSSNSTYNHYNHPMFSAGREDFNESVIHQTPPSPTRRSNKENTPPNPTRLTKDVGSTPTAAALSRQEPYQQRDDTTKRQVQMRGLTPEEIEKLAQPKVKRLVNVTQLCKHQLPPNPPHPI